MIKLYGSSAFSRAAIIQFYLEELGIPYEFVPLNLQAKEHRQPEYLALNPMGKVPTITDGALVLSESGAILLYLAQKYDPTYPKTVEQQAELYQWVLFANSTLVTGVFTEANRERELPLLMQSLNGLLQDDFVVGKTFSVADVALGTSLAYLPMALKISLTPYPGVARYVQKITARPAFQKSFSPSN